MNLQNVYKKIAEDINYLFTNIGNTLKFDKTFRAKVIRKESNGKYKVLYKNKEYLAKCDGTLNIDDMVWVCAPKNDWNELYVQLGKTLQNQVNQLNSNLDTIKSTPGLFSNYGSVLLNSQNASGVEGSELVFRGSGGNTGNNTTLDCYDNYFRIFGNFNDTDFHIYEFKADGIYLDYSKLPSNSDLGNKITLSDTGIFHITRQTVFEYPNHYAIAITVAPTATPTADVPMITFPKQLAPCVLPITTGYAHGIAWADNNQLKYRLLSGTANTAEIIINGIVPKA